MHVGMEKPIPKDLGEKQRDAVARQLGNVHACCPQARNLADRDAAHTLHHDDFGAAVVPDHLRDQHQVQPRHIAAQLGCAGRFTHQVELVVQVLVELGDYLARLEAPPIGKDAFNPGRHHAHQRQVLVDCQQHARAEHLDRNVTLPSVPTTQYGKVHLGNRRTGHRLMLERSKYLTQRLSKRPFDAGNRDLRGKWWHPVLQTGQFVGHIQRKQVAPCREHLPELDENWTESLQRLAQSLAARSVQASTHRQDARQHAQPAIVETVQEELVKPISENHPDDKETPEQAGHGMRGAAAETGTTKVFRAWTNCRASMPAQ